MDCETLDVIIVGAGLSGVGAACHLRKHCPGKSFAILEGREAMGGTWDLFRYPGIRSDSDMHTLGYSFKPWVDGKAIAEGPAILGYIHETAQEHGIESKIRYRHRVTAASWDSNTACWTLTVETPAGTTRLRANHLLMCAGYYSYERGYTPDFPGREQYRGRFVHPQQWPQDLDYRDKRVVVIGSGATAMTLVPAMAADTAHITMLQRSPTYVVSRPWKDRLANLLRALLPDRWAYAITRWKNVLFQEGMYKWTRRDPSAVKRLLLKRLRRKLDPSIDIDRHFTPRYNPWDQRLCLIPDDDLHEALNAGRASVVTDEIETLTANGIRLVSGEELPADIIVSATGLNLVVLGNIAFDVDGKVVAFHETWTYKGLMCSGVPNMVQTFGYINASWTLRADITAEYFCRLLNHMDALGVDSVTPELREQDLGMRERPWIDDFPAGYMQRAMPYFPKQGDHEPWINSQDYRRDRRLLAGTDFDDGALVFRRSQAGQADGDSDIPPMAKAG